LPRTGREHPHERRRAHLDYTSRDGTVTTARPVEPIAFAHEDGTWYLLAWCRRRRAGRTFRVDRITAARLTGEPCPPRDIDEVFGPAAGDGVAVAFD
jgi:proteasome accessory factor B